MNLFEMSPLDLKTFDIKLAVDQKHVFFFLRIKAILQVTLYKFSLFFSPYDQQREPKMESH